MKVYKILMNYKNLQKITMNRKLRLRLANIIIMNVLAVERNLFEYKSLQRANLVMPTSTKDLTEQ